jgi:hypothetical protein
MPLRPVEREASVVPDPHHTRPTDNQCPTRRPAECRSPAERKQYAADSNRPRLSHRNATRTVRQLWSQCCLGGTERQRPRERLPSSEGRSGARPSGSSREERGIRAFRDCRRRLRDARATTDAGQAVQLADWSCAAAPRLKGQSGDGRRGCCSVTDGAIRHPGDGLPLASTGRWALAGSQLAPAPPSAENQVHGLMPPQRPTVIDDAGREIGDEQVPRLVR